MTAARAGNPRESNRGAARAAGVPKPADPSMNPPNSQAMIMACTRLSVEMLVNPLLIASMAPLSLNVNSNRRAPKTIKRIFNAITNPFTDEARIQFSGVFHTTIARIRAMINARGMALDAGQRKATIKTKITTMGREASTASNPEDIKQEVYK